MGRLDPEKNPCNQCETILQLIAAVAARTEKEPGKEMGEILIECIPGNPDYVVRGVTPGGSELTMHNVHCALIPLLDGIMSQQKNEKNTTGSV